MTELSMQTIEMAEIDEIASFFGIGGQVEAGESFYPATTEEGLLNEADTADVEQEVPFLRAAIGDLKGFEQPERLVDLAAIDTGTIQIGSTERGVVVAVRGAVVIQRSGSYSLVKLGSKLIYISQDNAISLLKSIGQGLGKANMFIMTDENGVESPKSGPLSHIQDRVRNYVERKLQRFAVAQIEGGIVLFDGALSAMEWDTPLPYLQGTLDSAFTKGNSLVGICKKSSLQVEGVNVAYSLRETQEPCFQKIEETESRGVYPRSIAESFAVRLGPGGFSFRVDVCPYIVPSQEILNRLYRSSRMALGYPFLLKLAHIHSVFTKREVIQLQVLAAQNYGLRLQRPQDISILFAPFRRAMQ